MKRFLIGAAVLLGLAAQANADTITREGEYGTSVVTRSVEDGTYTAQTSWTGTTGGTYTQDTSCADRICDTGWTFNDRNDRVTTSERQTVWGKRGSRTTVETQRSDGKSWGRTVWRRR